MANVLTELKKNPREYYRL